jgi:choline transport protein
MAAMLFAGFIGVNAMQQTASRMTWALARDDALVFSTQLSKVHRRLNVPVQALVFNGAVVLLIGCLYMASTTGKT